MVGFDKDELVASCLTAVRSESDPRRAVKEIVGRTVSDPSAIEAAVRDRTESPMMAIWHRSEELTVLHIVWPPDVDLFAHDHNMWASIGIYGGREDNSFYRRLDDGRIERNTEKTLLVRDTISLGPDVVHSVANPTREWTAALHVYGGDSSRHPGRCGARTPSSRRTSTSSSSGSDSRPPPRPPVSPTSRERLPEHRQARQKPLGARCSCSTPSSVISTRPPV